MDWLIEPEGEGLQTFHVHDTAGKYCAGTFTSWGCDDEKILSKRIVPVAANLIIAFEEILRG